ncbi:MAG: adenosylmethionine--8-amino-7-oxononanoate transaminase [Nitrospira sp.]|nr:adenosylmethionine--8-amino-7-oxononanoate transaminase [Nitrospira sp.]
MKPSKHMVNRKSGRGGHVPCDPAWSSRLAQWDRRYVWHPFTQMKEWAEHTPLIIEKGKGSWLYDDRGNRYLDGTSSIWVNLHGHRHRTIDTAIRRQLGKVAHSTLLGAASPPSILLARALVRLAPKGLRRVFYSDNGSTAVEVALKMAVQYWQQQRPPRVHRKEFVRLDAAYHGDTVGSMSVGGVELFRQRFRSLIFPTHSIDAPYCYRCPLQLQFPSCGMACLDPLERVLKRRRAHIAGVMVEPVVQAVAGMITHPPGYLSRVRALCTRYNVLLIADEVATGFGRTGTMFACEQEQVTPDLLCLAKGCTGGYVPLGATLATDNIYEAFLGEYRDRRTFFHGHSYTGNALGCAAALANLEVFRKEKTLVRVRKHAGLLRTLLRALAAVPIVGDIRQRGLMVGIELVINKASRKPFPFSARMGDRVAMECRHRGLLLRPIGNVVILVPPLAASERELRRMVHILTAACQAVCSTQEVARR